MNQFTVWVFFAALSVVTKSSLGIADINRPVKYCIMERAHRMIGYNCAKLELRDIPSYLKTSTEVSNARGFRQPERSWNAFRTMQKLLHCVPTPAKPAVPFKLKLINLNWLEHQRLALGHFFAALTHAIFFSSSPHRSWIFHIIEFESWRGSRSSRWPTCDFCTFSTIWLIESRTTRSPSWRISRLWIYQEMDCEMFHRKSSIFQFFAIFTSPTTRSTIEGLRRSKRWRNRSKLPWRFLTLLTIGWIESQHLESCRSFMRSTCHRTICAIWHRSSSRRFAMSKRLTWTTRWWRSVDAKRSQGFSTRSAKLILCRRFIVTQFLQVRLYEKAEPLCTHKLEKKIIETWETKFIWIRILLNNQFCSGTLMTRVYTTFIDDFGRAFLQERFMIKISSQFSLECKIDPNTTFVETEEFHQCMSIRREVIEHKKAQLTWGIIAGGVIAFLVVFIGCLWCIHRRNVRQMSRKSIKINNQNVKAVKVQQLDPTELPDESVSSSPEKLLIKRSDV